VTARSGMEDPLPSATIAASHVEALLAVPSVLMGLSHVLQPAMWREYFVRLRAEGPAALVTRTFVLELWPALLIVVFHQAWSGPQVVITVYGHLLLLKIVLSMLAPAIGLRSLDMARKGDAGFRAGGVVLVALGALCAHLAF